MFYEDSPVASAIRRLEFLCETISPLLDDMDESVFEAKPRPDKWSKKEIIGHLIDSATNNHQRFVRTQFEENPVISYNQDQWNKYSFHQLMDKKELIGFWQAYNKYLANILQHIPLENLTKQCLSAEGRAYSLDFLIIDYVSHMEHHLKQIVDY